MKKSTMGNRMDKFKKNIENKILKDKFIGYNPYDLLESNFFSKINNRKILLILTQFFKFFPFNLRKLFMIRMQNSPKAMGLLLQSFLNNGSLEDLSEKIFENLISNKSDKFNGYTIGFPFPIALSHYKSKANEPSLIITLFIIYAFIESYLKTGKQKILEQILSFENVVENNLPFKETKDTLYYSYNFSKLNEVYNATAKVGKFYALLYKIKNKNEYKNKIAKILNYLITKQNNDGTWFYSEQVKYVDGFHTAFILEAIIEMKKIVNNDKIENMLKKGFDNYMEFFVKENGQPLYFHPKYKPKDFRKYFTETDIRDCAMGIVLLCKLNKKEEAKKIKDWTIENMYNNKKKYFYHFKEKLWINKIEYIRPQAWMYYALTVLEKSEVDDVKKN